MPPRCVHCVEERTRVQGVSSKVRRCCASWKRYPAGRRPDQEWGLVLCGITALYSPRGTISPSALEQATLRLAHRGPDGQRTWVSGDRRVGLGHARLSIIDLATGEQPIASEDEGLRIVVNGEFYDFERVQRDLEDRSHRLRTRSDSEIALHLYEDIGTACLRELRGEFALALWDRFNDTLFAARDRFGIKPFFYARSTAGRTYSRLQD